MINYILHLLLDAGVILGLTKILPTIQVKDYSKAVLVAFLISLFNVIIGWVFNFAMNLATLFLLTGIVRLLVTTIIIKIVDYFIHDFKVEGFWPALIIALCTAIVGGIFDNIL